jgi:hypothetical protein
MSENVTPNAPSIGEKYATAPARPRKSPPSRFPHRLTVCMATDQIEKLQEVKDAFRTTESFVIRMAFDTFCRTNGFSVSNHGGQNG